MREIKTAVITGPTGAIGSALCRLLLSKNIDVYAVCRKDSFRIKNLPKGVNIVFCDLSEINALSEKISSCDAFFHFAWAGTFGDARNDAYLQMKNIEYTLDAIKVAKSLGCKVFIGAGSQAEFGRCDSMLTKDTPTNPETGYGIAKLCAGNLGELACKNSEMDFIWTRVLSVYGPCDRKNSMVNFEIRMLLKGSTPLLTECTQMWNFLYCDDAADAFYLLAQKGIRGKTYIVANDESRPLKEYVEIIRDSINPDLPLGYGEFASNGKPVELSADISELKADTGFTAKTDFKDGIMKTIKTFTGKENER